MSAVVADGSAVLGTARRIATEIAARHADDVDRHARFPVEAVDALKEAELLSVMVPTELGGGGASVRTVSEICGILARGCSATAMVFAMHQLNVANLVRHLDPGVWHIDYLRRLHGQQRLISSCTSEMGTGGDMGRSVCAVTPLEDGRCRLAKQTPTMSYGAYCDDWLTTARRHPDADPTDQVMVLHSREQTDTEELGIWDTLGMRGTVSPPRKLDTTFAPEQILAQPFATMMSETIVPVSHLLWGQLWLGIATEAFERAHACVRSAARKAPGEPLPAARKLSGLFADLQAMRGLVQEALRDFEASDASPGREVLRTLPASLRFNALKIALSERAPQLCLGVLDTVGVMAFKNDSPYAVGRLLRDALSAQVMIANDRLHATNAGVLAIAKEV